MVWIEIFNEGPHAYFGGVAPTETGFDDGAILLVALAEGVGARFARIASFLRRAASRLRMLEITAWIVSTSWIPARRGATHALSRLAVLQPVPHQAQFCHHPWMCRLCLAQIAGLRHSPVQLPAFEWR